MTPDSKTMGSGTRDNSISSIKEESEGLIKQGGVFP